MKIISQIDRPFVAQTTVLKCHSWIKICYCYNAHKLIYANKIM